MEKDKYPPLKVSEMGPRHFEISFDRKNFGDTQKSFDASRLAGELNHWRNAICLAKGYNPEWNVLENIGYHIIELGKNALECADGGRIEIFFTSKKVTIIVSDEGYGFEVEGVERLTSCSGHGLVGVRTYADEFTLETSGAKFTKIAGSEDLLRSDNTGIQDGSRITFIKYLED